MKNSGIEWIGSIPEHWSVQRVNQAFHFKKSKAKENNPVVLSLTRDSIKIRDISTNEGQLAENYTDYNPVQVGDFLLNVMDLYSGANCNVSNVEGVISPAYANLRYRENINPHYYDYYFKVQYWTMAMFAHGKGISFEHRWTINRRDLLKYEIPKLPFLEQNKIVDILQNKISKVDFLLNTLYRQVEKLNEYKKNIIHLAISRGLNELTVFKSSGFDHIGDIPVHWTIFPLKAVFNMIGSGSTPTSDNSSYYDGGISWIQSGDLGNKYIETTQKTVSQEALKDFSSLNYYKGPFLVMAMYGASIGNVSISKIDATTNQACCVLSEPKPNISLDFIYYVLVANRDSLTAFGKGGTQPNISQQVIKPFRISIPPIEEQLQIVKYLHDKTGKIESLINLKREKIVKLNDYKKSLTYEYVTGKKEVFV